MITGWRGYIGSALTKALSKIACRLILVAQPSQVEWLPGHDKAEIVYWEADVSEMDTWKKTVSGVDHIFHLASREYYYRSGYDPESDLKYNALPILYLLEVCRQQNIHPQIIFASSANLYGAVDTLPVKEEMRDDPLTLWAIHKLTAEQYFRLYARKFGIRSATLRLANVYGPTPCIDCMHRVVLNKVIQQALTRQSLTTYANRHCVRDYVFLEDVVEAFLLAGLHASSLQSPVYLIGSGEGKTISDVWHLIADRVRLSDDIIVKVQHDESIPIEPLEKRNFVADTTRFQTLTRWRPLVHLVQGIDKTIAALQSGREKEI